MYTLDDIKKEDQEIASAITDEFEQPEQPHRAYCL